jgi:hypothetical protein
MIKRSRAPRRMRLSVGEMQTLREGIVMIHRPLLFLSESIFFIYTSIFAGLLAFWLYELVRIAAQWR